MYIQITSILIAFCALIVSIFSLSDSHRRTRGSVLLGCLETYLKIASHREDAINQRSQRLAKLFYREILDLLWSEFRMWNSGLIPKHVMYAWLHSSYRNYSAGKIEFESNDGNRVCITYREVWQNLLESQYFHSKDSFVEFMDLVHQGKIEDALNMQFNFLWQLRSYLYNLVKNFLSKRI